jgi:hypothetical protein
MQRGSVYATRERVCNAGACMQRGSVCATRERVCNAGAYVQRSTKASSGRRPLGRPLRGVVVVVLGSEVAANLSRPSQRD